MTDSEGNFLRDEKGNDVNRLTQPYEGNPSKTLFQYLNEEIDEYKKIYEEAIKNKK
jgi:hypothetical protein